MACSVPGCNANHFPVSQLINFPKNAELRERWKQAIECGTDMVFQTLDIRDLVICSWHFERETSKYQEPTIFSNRDGELRNIDSCRICLNFYERFQMVNRFARFGKRSLDTCIRQTLRTTLSDEDFLSKICYECLAKVDIMKSWIRKANNMNKQFYSLMSLAECEEMDYKVETNVALDYDFEQVYECENLDENEDEGYAIFQIEVIPQIKMEMDDPDEIIESKQSVDHSVSHFEHVDVPEVKQMKKRERSLNKVTGTLQRRPGRPRKGEVVCKEVKKRELQLNTVAGVSKRKPGCPKKGEVVLKPDSSTQQPRRRGRKPKKLSIEKRSYKDILTRKCYICDTLLEGHNELVAHLTTSHAAKVDYRCEECNKSFIQVTSYNHHLSFHDLINRPVKCTFCSLGFSCATTRKIHENREHNTNHEIRQFKRKNVGKVYQCETCGKTFRCNYQLREHDNYYHKKLNNSVCKLCGKSFPTKALLGKHHIVHSGEKPYKCDKCDESFKNSTCLTNHVLKHQRGHIRRKGRQSKVQLRRKKTMNLLLENIEENSASEGIASEDE